MILMIDAGGKEDHTIEFYKEQIKNTLHDVKIHIVNLTEVYDWNPVWRSLEEATAIVFMSPVWMDSLPAYVLRFLECVERKVMEGESIAGRFYAVLYTQLYESNQTNIAMDMLRCFCERANIVWGKGLGIGAADKMQEEEGVLTRIGKKQGIIRLLRELAAHAEYHISGDDVFTYLKGYPRQYFIYDRNRWLFHRAKMKRKQV